MSEKRIILLEARRPKELERDVIYVTAILYNPLISIESEVPFEWANFGVAPRNGEDFPGVETTFATNQFGSLYGGPYYISLGSALWELKKRNGAEVMGLLPLSFR